MAAYTDIVETLINDHFTEDQKVILGKKLENKSPAPSQMNREEQLRSILRKRIEKSFSKGKVRS